MDGKLLKASILHWAIQGKLVPQNAEDESGESLLERIFLAHEKKQEPQKNKRSKKSSIFQRAHIYFDNGVWYEQVGSANPKDISEDIFFEIPHNWVWCRWGVLSDSIQYGYNSPALQSGRIKMVRISDIHDNKIDWNKVPYCQISENEIKSYLLRKNDILFARTGGTVGKSYLVGDVHSEAIYAGYLIRTRYNSELLNPQYLKFFMESPLYWSQLREGTTTTAQPNCNGQKLAHMLLPLPPLAEQKRIVEKLNQILPLVEEYGSAQKQLDELNDSLPKNLKRSILQEAVQGKLVPHLESDGNSEKLVERIVKEKNELDKKIPKKRKDAPCKDISDDEVPFPIPETWRWLRLSSMAVMYTGNSINETEKLAKYTNVEGMDYIGTKDVGFDHKVNYKNGVAIPGKYIQDFKIAPANSVLLCIEGGSAGRKICVIDQDVCFGNKLCCFTTSNECVKYLYYYLQSPLFFDVFRDNKTGIIGGVGVNTLKELLIPIPPLAEQKRIVKKVEELFKAVDSMNLK